MIYLNLSGNLGNQLFKYSFAKKISIETGQQICVRYAERSYPQSMMALLDFNITCKDIYVSKFPDVYKHGTLIQTLFYSVKFLLDRIPRYSSSRFAYNTGLKDASLFFRMGVYCHGRGFVPLIIRKHKNYFINTLGECYQYYEDMHDILKDDFTPKHDALPKNSYIYNAACNPQSVCISIRTEFIKGDWGDNRKVCTMEFYNSAIAYMRKQLCKPQFIVFADDPQWVKENMNIENAIYEDGTDPVWEKLRMMYSCNHFILSNSTFSWWTQYLSNNQNKIVISPDKWFTDDYWTSFNEPSWITIDSEGRITS